MTNLPPTPHEKTVKETINLPLEPILKQRLVETQTMPPDQNSEHWWYRIKWPPTYQSSGVKH